MAASRPGAEACIGCDLCLLACPVWDATRDIRLTPHARARGLQYGASAQDLAVGVDACTLCASCEPACPENIALVDMVLALRGELAGADKERAARIEWRRKPGGERSVYRSLVLLPVAGTPEIGRICVALGKDVLAAEDDGSDIALAIESGVAIPENRRAEFLRPLRSARGLVVGDGLFARRLQSWLPGARIDTLGLVLSALPALRSRLDSRDLYIIETRAYHFGHARLVGYYAALRTSTGCRMNLDLQRFARATTAGSAAESFGRNRVDAREQARRIMQGVDFERVIVEDPRDAAPFEAVTDKPVLHLSQLL